MARKLKTYTTSAGFFDLAIAAPSMKAALEAWGSRSNLFNHGFARVSEDPDVVAATMAKPGVVLRRPVGSNDPFGEQASLPKNLPVGKASRPPSKRKSKKEEPTKPPVDDKAARAAAEAFGKEQKRRERERRREEAAQEKERDRRARAIDAALAAIEEERQDHEARIAKLEKDRATLERKAQAEEARWRKKKERLEAALSKARTVRYLRAV